MHITGGKYNSRKLISPKGENVRPTLSKTRAAVFDALYSVLEFEGKSFLDLFAGSGIMGLEAISRGFSECLAIEKDRKTFFDIKKNYELLGLVPNIICSDSLKQLKLLDKKFDVIYVDPPYFAEFYDSVLELILSCDVLNKEGFVIIEYPESVKVNTAGYEIVKQKKYGDKIISFLKWASDKLAKKEV